MTEFPKFVFIDDSTVDRGMPDDIVRSEMEVGPQKTRPKQNAPLYQVSFEASIPSRKFQEFNSWYRNDIKRTGWFMLYDPVDGIRKRFRIVEMESWKKFGTLMRSTMTLEAYDELQ